MQNDEQFSGKLVQVLLDTHFDIMKAMFPSLVESTAHLPKQKRNIIPILMYVTVQSVLRNVYHSSLLLLRNANTLKGGKLSVSEENLSHANQIWKLLGSETLQDCHDAYLKLYIISLCM